MDSYGHRQKQESEYPVCQTRTGSGIPSADVGPGHTDPAYSLLLIRETGIPALDFLTSSSGVSSHLG